MSFENFPYSNFHELNLDWILQKLKEAYSSENPPDYPVKSVNGQTGDVIIAIPSNFVQSVNGETGDVVLYRNPLTQFPATDEVRWNLFRICDGTETGIEFDENGASRIEGIRRIRIYDEDNPPDYPVTSVNGQTGDVQITAGVQSVNGKTGNVVTPFVNPNTDILAIDTDSPSILWGFSRNVSGGNVALYITTGGTNPQAFIRFTPTEGDAINLPLLTTADIPSGAGVVSVNSKTGVVKLYGSDIELTDTDTETVSSYINNILSRLNGQVTIELIPNSYVTTTGVITEYSGWSRTNYIDCENYTQLYVTKTRSTPGAYNVFYDANKQFISNFYLGTDSNPITINIPQNAKYVILSNSDYIMEEIGIELRPNLKSISIYDQQITALQTSDTTQNQQISALQSTDATHTQQISALQTAIDNIQRGAGIKEIKLSEVVTLPARYPATGTDTDIKTNMACVNAILSRPGVQRTNFTVEFFDGYLTISGTMQGLTDITLYLTEV